MASDFDPEYGEVLLNNYIAWCIYLLCFDKSQLQEDDYWRTQLERCWNLKNLYRRVHWSINDISHLNSIENIGELYNDLLKNGEQWLLDREKIDLNYTYKKLDLKRPDFSYDINQDIFCKISDNENKLFKMRTRASQPEADQYINLMRD